jgi:phosphoesterase RecJ-like protein
MKTISISEGGVILDEIKKARKILMHFHPNADGDSLGGVLGLYHTILPLVEERGGVITIIQGDTPMPEYLSFLPGFDIPVKKNLFEIDLSEFDLFLILDSGSPNQISKIAPVSFPTGLKTIVIDHHSSNQGFGDINLIEAAYPAVCQIISELLGVWKMPISKNAAICLFIGLYTDTGGFKWTGTTEKTFIVAADLVHIVPDMPKYLSLLDNSRTKEQILLQKLFLNSLETWFSGTVAVVSVSYQELVDNNINPISAGGSELSSLLKTVIGWDIAIACTEQSPGTVKLSFRSKADGPDVTVPAIKLNGGGHRSAAGGQVQGTLLEAKAILKDTLAKSYQKLSEKA